MADRETVTVRDPQGHVREIPKGSVPFFVNQGYVVLDSAGRVNSKATSTAKKESN